ncbi:MAG: hypothetical protein IPM97_07095 [Bdellovibrionaceae bacterium]|nr:hypothetical protein [Pseudobdellovibrionaceae bacterium]
MKLIGTLILTMSVMACSPNNSSTNPAKKVTQPETTPLPTTTKGSDVLTTSPNSSSSTKTADKVTPLVVMQTPSSPISVANIPTVSASFQTCQASIAVKTNTNNPLEAMSLESAALDWLKSLGYVRGGNTSEIELELHHDEEDGSGCSAIEVNRRCHVTAKISSDKKEPNFLTGSAENVLRRVSSPGKVTSPYAKKLFRKWRSRPVEDLHPIMKSPY